MASVARNLHIPQRWVPIGAGTILALTLVILGIIKLTSPSSLKGITQGGATGLVGSGFILGIFTLFLARGCHRRRHIHIPVQSRVITPIIERSSVSQSHSYVDENSKSEKSATPHVSELEPTPPPIPEKKPNEPKIQAPLLYHIASKQNPVTLKLGKLLDYPSLSSLAGVCRMTQVFVRCQVFEPTIQHLLHVQAQNHPKKRAVESTLRLFKPSVQKKCLRDKTITDCTEEDLLAQSPLLVCSLAKVYAFVVKKPYDFGKKQPLLTSTHPSEIFSRNRQNLSSIINLTIHDNAKKWPSDFLQQILALHSDDDRNEVLELILGFSNPYPKHFKEVTTLLDPTYLEGEDSLLNIFLTLGISDDLNYRIIRTITAFPNLHNDQNIILLRKLIANDKANTYSRDIIVEKFVSTEHPEYQKLWEELLLEGVSDTARANALVTALTTAQPDKAQRLFDMGTFSSESSLASKLLNIHTNPLAQKFFEALYEKLSIEDRGSLARKICSNQDLMNSAYGLSLLDRLAHSGILESDWAGALLKATQFGSMELIKKTYSYKNMTSPDQTDNWHYRALTNIYERCDQELLQEFLETVPEISSEDIGKALTKILRDIRNFVVIGCRMPESNWVDLKILKSAPWIFALLLPRASFTNKERVIKDLIESNDLILFKLFKPEEFSKEESDYALAEIETFLLPTYRSDADRAVAEEMRALLLPVEV